MPKQLSGTACSALKAKAIGPVWLSRVGRSESPACLAPVTWEAGCGRVPAPTLRLCLGVRKSVFQVMVSSLLVQNMCWAFKGRRTEDKVHGKEGGLRIPCPRCQQSTLAFNHFVCWEISFEEQKQTKPPMSAPEGILPSFSGGKPAVLGG